MPCVYILKHGNEDLFKIGRTKGTVAKTIEQLSRGNPYRLTEFDRIETDGKLHARPIFTRLFDQGGSSDGGGTEFFRIDPEELREFICKAKNYVKEYLSAKDRRNNYPGRK